MNHKQDAESFLASTTRQMRYRLSGKSLRFKVYQAIEAIVVVCFLMVLALVVLDTGGLLAIGIGALAALLSLIHFFQLTMHKPWLPMTAAFEAIIVWAVYSWWISNYVSIPHFGVLCVFLFTIRFWQRGEREVSLAALAALRTGSHDTTTDPIT